VGLAINAPLRSTSRIIRKRSPPSTSWSKKKVVDNAQDAPDTVYLAEDEASLYLQTTLQAIWAPRGQTPLICSDTQRDKLYFYGTLNLHTGQEIVLRSEEMNAAVSVQHLEQLLATYPNRPIVLFWDRASWHKGKMVEKFLHTHPRLEIVYFPVGAPELNPQEHVWMATASFPFLLPPFILAGSP